MLPRSFIVFVFVAAASAADLAVSCEKQISTAVDVIEGTSYCYDVVLEALSWNSAYRKCRTAGGNLVAIKDNITQTSLVQELSTISAAKDRSFWVGLYPYNHEQEFLTWADGPTICITALTGSERVDCHKHDHADELACTTLGCCWKALDNYPWCYYPSVDNGPLPFTAWAEGQPSKDLSITDFCVLLWSPGNWTWDDQSCDNANGYICQFARKEVTTQPPTVVASTEVSSPPGNLITSATTPSQTTGTASATALSKASPTPVQTPSASTSSQGPSESTPSLSATTSRLSSVQTSSVQTTSQTASSTLSPTAGVSTPGQTSGVTTLVKTSSVLTPTLTPSLTPSVKTSSLTAGVTTPRLTPGVITSSLTPSVTTSSQTAGVSTLSPTPSIATASATVTFPSQTASVTPSPTASVNASSTTPTNGTIIVEGSQALSQGGIIGISVLIVFLVAVALFAVAYMVRQRMLTKTNEELVRSNEYTNIGYNPDVEDNEVKYFNEG